MKTFDNQHVTLSFIQKFNAYGVSDEQIENIRGQNLVPQIELSLEDYASLAPQSVVSEKLPLIAFLLGREENYYTISLPYAKAIIQSGVRIKFLTYHDIQAQMKEINGLILPGGSFISPEEFYTDKSSHKSTIEPRAQAYLTAIKSAEKNKLPILGICAGAQMLGGMHGMKMYRNLKEYTQTPLEHKTKELEAHDVFIFPNTPLANILGTEHIETNSRHKEAMLPNDEISDLKIYAATADGTPEAWGNEEKNILCIQWHPEDFAARGNEKMQKIYNWLAEKARQHQYQE